MKKFAFSIVFVLAAAISAYAQTADQHFKAGLEFYKKAYDQAITSFSASISLNLNMSGAWFNRGQSYYYKGRLGGTHCPFGVGSPFLLDLREGLTARQRPLQDQNGSCTHH
jgi:tetratricopeptide (TPR) repeat protein